MSQVATIVGPGGEVVSVFGATEAAYPCGARIFWSTQSLDESIRDQGVVCPVCEKTHYRPERFPNDPIASGETVRLLYHAAQDAFVAGRSREATEWGVSPLRGLYERHLQAQAMGVKSRMSPAMIREALGLPEPEQVEESPGAPAGGVRGSLTPPESRIIHRRWTGAAGDGALDNPLNWADTWSTDGVGRRPASTMETAEGHCEHPIIVEPT